MYNDKLFIEIEDLLKKSPIKIKEFLEIQGKESLDIYIYDRIKNDLKNNLFNKNFDSFFEKLDYSLSKKYFSLNNDTVDYFVDIFLSKINDDEFHYLQKFKDDFNLSISCNNIMFIHLINKKSFSLLNFIVNNNLPLIFDNSIYLSNGTFNNPKSHNFLNKLIDNKIIQPIPIIKNLTIMDKTFIPRFSKKTLNSNIDYINSYITDYNNKSNLNNKIIKSLNYQKKSNNKI